MSIFIYTLGLSEYVKICLVCKDVLVFATLNQTNDLQETICLITVAFSAARKSQSLSISLH